MTDPTAQHVDSPHVDSWADELVAAAGEGERRRIAVALGRDAPASYREQTAPGQAVLDVDELLALYSGTAGGQHGRERFVVRPLLPDRFHIRRFAEQPVELTELLPMLESFGLVVEESVPHRLEMLPDAEICIDDIGVHLRLPAGVEASHFDPVLDGRRLVDAVGAVAQGSAEVDRLNGLVPMAGMVWREVSLLRAYTNYWGQCSSRAVPLGDLEDALLAFPAAARAVADYFFSRFDPAVTVPESVARAAFVAELAKVPLLRWDRALRIYLGLVDATVRTNFFQRDAAGESPDTVTLKFHSSSVPQLPAPLPLVETWVHSPKVEGIHLRAGLVARGGIRWSERPTDFRTEVLDLMVAQVKKNAVIVPTGAKGGFVCRSAASPERAEVRSAYATFVRSLLDITDNLVSGKVAGPEGILTHDGADPYLVVAADKGTADFSDLANDISAEHGFWLGDAFASGGSHGYNHKAMGITARGAWVAVRRHFHQLGIDVQSEPVSVAGVGDMSGDVFGNGMLSSKAIRLVAAFDHRHIFLDPDPDPEVSFAERARLAGLARSSWGEYARDAISKGGGVWSRDTKLVALSTRAQQMLGVERAQMSPPELISAILEAPVDLLWFGGVGTFVKAADESDADVADKANDEVRVTADRIRARVICEGGNLGITQRARIRYSRRGGRINTDFIDNAAGVAISDREVNLKILLARAVEDGRLDAAGRDEYLEGAQDEVAADVLRQIGRNVAVLNRAVQDSGEKLDAYAALLDLLESSGAVNRQVEALPDATELAVRRDAGAGMARPELAVLLAFAKSDLGAALESAPLVSDPSLAVAAQCYFPPAMRRDFADLVAEHRLYDQLLATAVAGEIVDQLGIAWAHETAAELGRELPVVAAAFWAARQVVGAQELWEDLDERWSEISADADARLNELARGAVGDLARNYLRRAEPLAPGAIINEDAPVADALAAMPVSESSVNELVASGVDVASARRWLAAAARARAGEVAALVRATGRLPTEVASAFSLVDEAAGTGKMEQALRGAGTQGRFESWLVRATLDDIADWRLGAAREVLQAVGDPADPIVGWAARHDAQLAGARRFLSALDAKDAHATTIVAIALRRLPRPPSPQLGR